MELPAHQLTMTVLMTPDTANFAGNVHGGTLAKKSMMNQRDLALAYSPGVAAACEEIAADPARAFRYTARGNLVAAERLPVHERRLATCNGREFCDVVAYANPTRRMTPLSSVAATPSATTLQAQMPSSHAMRTYRVRGAAVASTWCGFISDRPPLAGPCP
jgi:hypothetical protein